jgi:aminoglycoside phosphotransferase (APT) family kinase protein
MNERFVLERKEIGKGRQATVYLWNGFAYKVYNEGYPLQRIDFEMQIQGKISQTSLPVAKYYKTDCPHIIKMDYISGVTLSEKILKEHYQCGIEDLVNLQRQIHRIDNIDLPNLRKCLQSEISGLDCAEERKIRALKYLSEIGDANTLCHLDFHPSNVISHNDMYYIVDWFNARLGQPIFDYARTYIILFEAASEFSEQYMLLLKNTIDDLSQLDKAIYIMALLRAKEMNGSKSSELLARHDDYAYHL